MLTKRENQILGLVAVGLTPDEIGDRLFISRETVRKTIANAKSKLSFGKATELACWFVCRHFGSEYENFKRQILAACMLALFAFTMNRTDVFTRRARCRRVDVVESLIPQP
jgi:DNA-binding CsgD family transcriptional regulator